MALRASVVAGHVEMMHGGRGHGCGPNLAVGGEHLLDRPKSAAAEFSRHGIGAIEVRIDHSRQAYRFALLFQFFVHARVIASENAHANDCDENRILGWQEYLFRADCRQKIVTAKAGKSIWNTNPDRQSGESKSPRTYNRKDSAQSVTCEPLRC